MKQNLIISLILLSGVLVACSGEKNLNTKTDVIQTNKGKTGVALEIRFLKGKYHNHPTFAFWVEDLEGNYIETLYVTQYLGKGIYGHGSLGDGKWDSKPGPAERPSALPYWLHKQDLTPGNEQNLPTSKNPVPDAITGATPMGDFVLETLIDKPVPERFRLMMEINQTWDWNEYWNNNKFPGDFDYAVSCQPALVYSVVIDKNQVGKEFYLNPIGHSHESGKTGELFTDLSTITTAKDIVNKVSAKIVSVP